MVDWQVVLGLAAKHDGIVFRQHLERLVAGPPEQLSAFLRWAVESRRLERLDRGVYRLAGAQPTWRQRAVVALLSTNGQGALSHASAAMLHGLDGFSRPSGLLDLSVMDRLRRKLPEGVRLHRPRRPFRVLVRHGLAFTTVTRTLVDLAASLSPEQLEHALDSAQRRYPRLPSWLADELAALGTAGRRGLGQLDALLLVRAGQRTDSALELPTWRQLRGHGFRPRLQYEVTDHTGAFIMRVDFAFPAERVAVHTDSYQWHGSRSGFDKDAAQRNRLHAAGWLSLIVTKPMLASTAWLDHLRRVLSERAPQRSLPFAEVGP